MKGRGAFAFAVCLLAASAAWAKVGGGNITFSVNGASDVVYSHEFHVLRAGLKCTNCHYRIFYMEKDQKKWTMADMAKGRACGACHNGQQAFSVQGNCEKCHK